MNDHNRLDAVGLNSGKKLEDKFYLFIVKLLNEALILKKTQWTQTWRLVFISFSSLRWIETGPKYSSAFYNLT